MEQIRMMRCGLCNSRADVREMRYHKSGEYLICRPCHEKQFPGSRVVVEKPQVPVRDVSSVTMPRAGKIGYHCKNCGYSFARARDHSFELCPYCGKRSVSIMRGGAQSLLDSSEP